MLTSKKKKKIVSTEILKKKMEQASNNNEKVEQKIEISEEEQIASEYKDSLLDAIRAQHEINKDLRCTRVLYIGQMVSIKQKDIIEKIHNDFIEKERKNNKNITGALLFINNNLFYHMLEVESLQNLKSLFDEMIYDPLASNNFFQQIDPKNKSKQININPELSNLTVKICCISEEITREFPIWSIRQVNLPGGTGNNNAGNDDEQQKDKTLKQEQDEDDDDDELSEDQESLQEILFSTMKGMIEIGRQLCMKQDNDAALKLFQSSQREIMNRFPTPDKIDFFMQSKLLFDLKGFKQYFFEPINVKLESEYTWPIEPMISF